MQQNNGFQFFMMLQNRLQTDPVFAAKFRELAAKLQQVPGLQQQVMQIMTLPEKQQQAAINRLPDSVKQTVAEIFNLLQQ